MKKFAITTGKDYSKGLKVIIYGVEGIGKTTLASNFPDPIFIDTEGSTSQYDGIKRLPAPTSWAEIDEMLDYLSSEKPPFETVVIDSFDWAEMKIVEEMCAKNGWSSIESAGYGKGYTQAAEKVAQVLNKLTQRFIDKGKNVVLTCHAQVRKFELPEEQGTFDKYELKLGSSAKSKTAPLVKEWADMILFCNYKTNVESGGDKKAKARGGKKRVMYTEHSAVWDGKNRHGLPEELPLDYKHIAHIFKKPEGAKKPEQKLTDKPSAEVIEELATDYEATLEKLEKEVHGEDWGLAVIFDIPDEALAKEMTAFAKKKKFSADQVQVLLYNIGRVKRPDFPLEKVPLKFWKAFMRDYDSKYAEEMKKVQSDPQYQF